MSLHVHSLYTMAIAVLQNQLVNCAVKSVLPFDPDASDLPVAKPVTLRSSASLVGLEKVVGDVAQARSALPLFYTQWRYKFAA